MIGFALELAYALEAKAKSLNQEANLDYSMALSGDDVSGVSEDQAWEECRRTGKWCDEWADAVSELEDAWFVANGRYEG